MGLLSRGDKKVVLTDATTCDHCSTRATNALQHTPGVRQAVVDLENKREEMVRYFAGQASDGSLIAATMEAGYQAQMA